MFERFSEGARAAVVASQSEAKNVGAPVIAAPHLLLGVLATADDPLRALLAGSGLTLDGLRAECAALAAGKALGAEDAAALDAIGIDLDAVRARLEATFGEGVLDPPAEEKPRGFLRGAHGHIPFDRGARKVLELSLREAIARKDRTIRSEHVLLGVLRSDDRSATALVEPHVSRNHLRHLLSEHLDAAA